MRKQQTMKKMVLTKDTLRALESGSLRDVAGGVTFFPWQSCKGCPTNYSSCC